MTGAAPAAGPASPDTGGSPGFWDFSLEVYADPATARACLDLQNRFDLDVNLLLFCLFAGRHGRRLSVDDLQRLDEAVLAWRTQVVHPLRAARTWLKSAPASVATESLRRQVLDAELAAEHQQQLLIEQRLPVAPGKADAAACTANLRHYAAALGRPPGGPLDSALSALCTLATDAAARRRTPGPTAG